jgi:hypothetical protein
MKISINIPSWKRPRVLTLDYLPTAKVWIDKSDLEAYRTANIGFENNIVVCPDGVQGNLARVRNFILRTEFSQGADVVLLVDDDLEAIYHYEKVGNNAYEKVKLDFLDFEDWVEKNSILAADIGARMWGVNNLMDKLYYNHFEPLSTRKHIGGIAIFLKDNECFYDEQFVLKQDVDMMVQQLNRYRVVWRLNNYFALFKQWTNAGGVQTIRNIQKEIAMVRALRKKWGSDLIVMPEETNDIKKFNNSVFKIPIKGV